MQHSNKQFNLTQISDDIMELAGKIRTENSMINYKNEMGAFLCICYELRFYYTKSYTKFTKTA